MSIKSWKEEFIPPIPTAMNEVEATEHSLHKWKGLRKKNYERHGLVKDNPYDDFDSYRVCTPNGQDIYTPGAIDCALCVNFYDESEEYSCRECPIFLMRGKSCCEEVEGESLNPYDTFFERGDPEPMIKLLEDTLKYVNDKERD